MADDHNTDGNSTQPALPVPQESSADAPTVNLGAGAARTIQTNYEGNTVGVSEVSTVHDNVSVGATVNTHLEGQATIARGGPSVSGNETASTRLLDEGEIARGGMGAIHLVFDRAILRHAAMKVLHGGDTMPEGAQERFIEEARITGQLEHPNIVPVYDLQLSADGRPEHFTMKLVHGRTLSEVIREKSTDQLSGRALEEMLRIFLKVCEALSFAHSRGVVHRDLKPDNIMVGSHGQVYVMDWGIALVLDDQIPAPPSPSKPHGSGRIRTQSVVSTTHGPTGVAGTPNFMAPEQTTGRLIEIDGRTDIYCLGGILYTILTAKTPRHGANSIGALLEKASVGEIVPLDVAAPSRRLPPGLCRIALKAMSTAPDDRHQTVAELSQDVETFLHGGGWFESLLFPAGTLIISEGDDGDTAYIITDGTCEVFKDIAGKRQSLRRMGPGDVFGEMAVLTSQPRTASVRAVDDVTALVVTRQSLEDDLADKAWLGAFVRALAARFNDLDKRLSERGRSRS